MTSQAANRAILVPVDDAEENERAMSWALDNLYKQGDVVHILHVVPHHQHSLAPQTAQQEQLLVDQARNWIDERFRPILESKKAEASICVQKADGDVDAIGQHVCHMAEQLQASVVVCAANNKGNVQYLLGSNTQFIMRNSSRTVMVMH